MQSLICAGGSGIKVLESFVYLCAMGLGPRDKVQVLIIDSDISNGNADRTNQLLLSYNTLQCKLSGSYPQFQTEIDAGTIKGNTLTERRWTPTHNGQKLNNFLKPRPNTTDNHLIDLFFTTEEQTQPLDKGFYAHPNIGSAVITLLDELTEQEPWSSFLDNMKSSLNQGVHVVNIVGSIFGGTGASAIEPIANFLRQYVRRNVETKVPDLKIAAYNLTPYFSFVVPPNDALAGVAADASHFHLYNRSAVEYYRFLSSEGRWNFDSISWFGCDKSIHAHYTYSPGGGEQKNPAHWVEVLAATSIAENMCHYNPASQISFSGSNQDTSILSWDTIPLQQDVTKYREKFLTFHQAALAHTALMRDILSGIGNLSFEDAAYYVPWYKDQFSEVDTLSDHEETKVLTELSKFFDQFYLNWLRQLHLNGSGNAVENRIHLFHPQVFLDDKNQVSINNTLLNTLLWQQNYNAPDMDCCFLDDFFANMCRSTRLTSSGVAKYFELIITACPGGGKKEQAKR